MFDTHQRYTGTQYTATVALLVMAFVATPAAMLLSRPLGYGSACLAVAFSLFCCAWARRQWMRQSELTIPSLLMLPARTK